MKASKALTVSVSVFRGRILWRFSLSKNNISPAAPDLELILFPLWYWPIMNAHTKQQQDKVFETDFIDSQKPDPPFAHLLALSQFCMCSGYFSASLTRWRRNWKRVPTDKSITICTLINVFYWFICVQIASDPAGQGGEGTDEVAYR